MKAFFKAVKKGDISTVTSALEKDIALVKAQDDNGFTPLMWAAHKGHFDIVKLLVISGACTTDIHADTGSAVIHFAAEGGNTDILKFLIQKNADVHQLNVIDKQSVLHYAILAGKTTMLTTLIDDYGCDINAQNTEGDTPAHIAVKANNLVAVKILLQNGADAQIKNKTPPQNKTILELAINHWKLDILHCIASHLGIDETDYLQCRILANVFNHTMICQLLSADGNNYTDGGYHLEALSQMTQFLSDYLEYISEEELFDRAGLQLILSRLLIFKVQQYNTVSVSTEENVPTKITETSPYFVTGFDTHAMYGSAFLEQEETNKCHVISIYERGYFARQSQSKVLSVWRIKASGEHLIEEIVQHFLAASVKDVTSASRILLEDIPASLNTTYQYDSTIEQNAFLHGHCYFENLKTLLLDELIRHYGIHQGKLIYKHFDLFMHCTALNNFNRMSEHMHKDAIVDLAKAVAIKKNDKLAAINDEFCLIEEQPHKHKKHKNTKN